MHNHVLDLRQQPNLLMMLAIESAALPVQQDETGLGIAVASVLVVRTQLDGRENDAESQRIQWDREEPRSPLQHQPGYGLPGMAEEAAMMRQHPGMRSEEGPR
jgi:hypothetical protein